jgi:hypothetical protein
MPQRPAGQACGGIGKDDPPALRAAGSMYRTPGNCLALRVPSDHVLTRPGG